MERLVLITSTVVLKGQLVVEGVKFLWWVTDGRPTRVTVSHAIHGTETRIAEKNPEAQARQLARAMLAGEPPAAAGGGRR